MIRLRRPPAQKVLDARTQSYLVRKSAVVHNLAPRDERIGKAWAAFLSTQSRDQIAKALDAYTRAKCDILRAGRGQGHRALLAKDPVACPDVRLG